MALKETIENNPVATAGAAATVTMAIVLVAARTGIVLDTDEKQTLGQVVALLAPAVAAWWARRHVVGPKTFKAETGKEVSDI